MSIIGNLKDKSTILFFGDSITDGGRGRNMDGNHILGHGFAYMCSAKLSYEYIHKQFQFANKGISGNTVLNLLERVDDDVIKIKPDLVNILVGINDVFDVQRSGGSDAANPFMEKFKELISKIKTALPNTVITVCEPFYLESDSYENIWKNTPYIQCEEDVKPLNATYDKEQIEFVKKEISKIQEYLREYAAEENLVLVELQKEFDRLSKTVSPRYLIWDSVHPSVTGHALIARAWLDMAEKDF